MNDAIVLGWVALLRQRFGPAFDEYAAMVPAFLPGVGRRSSRLQG